MLDIVEALDLLFLGSGGGVCGLYVLLLVNRIVSKNEPSHNTSDFAALLFFGAFFIVLLAHVLWRLELTIKYPHLESFELPFVPLIPIALWIYVRSMTETRAFKFWRALWPHTIFSVWCGLLRAPFYVLDAKTKLLVADDALGDAEVYPSFPLLDTGSLMFDVSYPLICCGYMIAVARRLNFHAKNVENHLSSVEGKKLKWLRSLLVILSLFLALELFDMLDTVFMWGISELHGNLGGVFLLSIILASGWYGAKQQPVYSENTSAAGASQEPDVKEKKYSKSALDAEKAERILCKLDKVMEEKRLYVDPSLSLSKLSALTGVTENNVSQSLNVYRGQSFFDYVNGWRIEEAKRQLEKTDIATLDIAMAVGFNSRSTFNVYFKRIMDMPPGEYRAASRA